MKKLYQILFISLFLVPSIVTSAQEGNEILMNIGTTGVTKAEFERIYHKNNSALKSSDQKSLNEYLELFINFKLKVIEAESLKLDTSTSFKNELAGYRDQLAKSYLNSDEYTEELIKEAYERSKWEIEVSHILVRCDENATPGDSTVAYNKIQALWGKLKKGEDFKKLARESSEDPNTAKNDGHIGYFTIFQMIYPFETMAYNTSTGSYSSPFRSKFGYHILKVLNRIPSRGEVKASHIMKAFPQGSTPDQIEKARKDIYSLYDSIKAGGDFSKLAKKYSDDGYSGNNGGDLGWFGVGRMIPEFETVAFSLKNKGDYSEPFKTKYGWHIVKLIDKKQISSFEESKEKLKQMVKRDDRSRLANQSKVNILKKEYAFNENLKNLEPFYTLVDSTIFKTPWKKEKAAGLNGKLFTLGPNSYTQAGFAEFLSSKSAGHAMPIVSLVNNLYKDYVNSIVLDYEKSRLEEKYPDFRYLMQEYHDGILLFDLTDKLVWSRALKDSSGLVAFYASNIKIDSIRKKYMWKDRLQATIYTCSNDSIAKLARTAAVKREKNKLGKDFIFKTVCPKDSLHKSLKIEEGKFEKSENGIIDNIKWEQGLSESTKKDGKIVFVYVQKKLQPELKTLDESRGLSTADYQDYLEKQWIASLRQKYKISVNKDVLSSVR
jgi:peptidyl-prolyl cis-trans isomerase SurA